MHPIAQLPAAAAAWLLIAGLIGGFVTDLGDVAVAAAVLLFAAAAPWCWPLWASVVSHAVALGWLLTTTAEPVGSATVAGVVVLVLAATVTEGLGLRWLASADGDDGLATLVGWSYLLTVVVTAGALLAVWAPTWAAVLSAVALPAAVVRILALWRLGRRFAS